MSESAIESPGRTARRNANTHRLSVCAQRLADEHGVDGFTMDELAAEAGVSRRTLFNYFPTKDDAILGPQPEVDADLLAQFRSGGPTGDLLDDLAALVRDLVAAKSTTREDVAVIHRVMEANPRLMKLAHERFHAFGEAVLSDIETREGTAYDAVRARVAITVLGALVALALDTFVHRDADATLSELFDIAVSHATTLLA